MANGERGSDLWPGGVYDGERHVIDMLVQAQTSTLVHTISVNINLQ